MPVTFQMDRWLGNQWPSIDIMPVEVGLYLPILFHLSRTYKFKMPVAIDILDGYASDFLIGTVPAKMHIDNYTFSFACADEVLRNRVLDELQSLPSNFFDAALQE